MLLLWYASFLVSIMTMIFGISRRSWFYMLISAILFVPISYYFLGINIALKYVGLTPIILLALAVFFCIQKKSPRLYNSPIVCYCYIANGPFNLEEQVYDMIKERPGLLAIVIITWSAYFICAMIFGFGLWVVNVLSLASVIVLGILLLTVPKKEENKNDL